MLASLEMVIVISGMNIQMAMKMRTCSKGIGNDIKFAMARHLIIFETPLNNGW